MPEVVVTNTPRAGETPEQIEARTRRHGFARVDRSALSALVDRSLRSDPVSAPSHYRGGNGIEAIDVSDGFDLNANMAKAVEYVLRADRKGRPIEDLKKAVAYLNREIAKREHFHATGERYLPLGQGFAK
ncbi:MAG: DUF3310 domain-containing protein [Rhizobiales bacterium]|nr:DUF3310 domain-containing protein [Hyphomicrobiales bacterium]